MSQTDSPPCQSHVNSQEAAALAAIVPKSGNLVALKTYRETHAVLEIGEAYAIEIPLKVASSLLKYLENALPLQGQHNLQHLRRFVKPQALPESLRPVVKAGQLSLHFLVCQTNVISLEALKSLLSTYVPTETRKIEARIHRISVPLQPPNSEDQARVWSQQFWPAVYKRSNPLGPQPAFLERAQGEIASQASYFMSLAWAMALEGKANRLGEAIGAVIVGEGRPIAVVADGRYAMRNTFTGDDSASQTADNILAHSALRGIALIAQKRLSQSQRPMPPTEYTSFKDYPITPVECKFYQASTLPENGYLCVDLDIYVTHEPCIMCSMALLHSRFRRVIFGKSMPRTGGLHSTNDGYGIWWRDELNWKILCWQWEDDGSNKGLEDETALSENIHV